MLQVGLSENIAFVFYLVSSSLTMLNMLIRVIRDVVGKVAADNRDDGGHSKQLVSSFTYVAVELAIPVASH